MSLLISDGINLRDEVLAFARLMEQRLRDHDADKGASWKAMNERTLVVHAVSKGYALETAVREEFKDRIRHAVDLANYCMMIADVAGALKENVAELTKPTEV